MPAGLPTFQFPAGSMIGATKVGGRFASFAQMRVTRVGRATLASRIPGIIAGVQVRCNMASEESAERIAEDAMDRAPVSDEDHNDEDGPRLSEGYYVVKLDLVDDYAVAIDTRYAPYVEFGSAHAEGQPHLIPAVEAERGPYINRMTLAMQQL